MKSAPAASSAARARLLGVVVVATGALALGVPLLYQRALGLPPAAAEATRRVFLLLLPVLTVVLGATIWIGLSPSDRPPPDAEARRRALELPFRLALVAGLGGLGLALAATALGQRHLGGTAPLGLFLCTAVMVLVLVVPIYALARALVAPLALRHATSAPPTGRPLSLRVQLGYTVFAIAAAALVPAAMFADAQLDRAGAVAARERALASLGRLGHSVAELERRPALLVATRTPLGDGQRVLLRTAAGALEPADAVDEVRGLAFVERPLTGALFGDTLRVYYRATARPPLPLLLVTAALLVLALGVASQVGTVAAEDVRSMSLRIAHLAHDAEAPPIHLATREVRGVAWALRRLLGRLPAIAEDTGEARARAEETRRLEPALHAHASPRLYPPLRAISGFAALLASGREGELTPAQHAVLATMQASALTLERLFDELSESGRLDRGAVTLRLQPTAPAELGRVAAAELPVRVTVAPELSAIAVDALRLGRALRHLCRHAVDEARGGAVDLAIGGDAARLLIEVAWSPPPAAPLRPHALGLGLVLAQRLIALHGGTLTAADSGPGRQRLRAEVPALPHPG